MSMRITLTRSSLLFILAFCGAHVLAQPKISSFAPDSGPAGTTVTITGSGFGATPGNNGVYFGTVGATVTAVSATSLTVTVPAGANNTPLSVINFENGLTGYASRPFTLTFNNPFGQGAIPANFYQPKIDLSTVSLPYFVALGDLDGNRTNDVVLVNANSNTMSIFQNRIGNSGSIDLSFEPRVDFGIGLNPRSVALGDLDADGKADIVVANTGENRLSVFRNNVNGTITNIFTDFERQDFGAKPGAVAVAIGDVDGDGKPDIVIANPIDNTVSVLRNTYVRGTRLNGASFAPGVDFATGVYPRFIALSDLDGDGKLDIAVANERSNSISVLRNTAAPGSLTASSLAAKVDFATGINPPSLAASDMDGDSKPDLVVVNYGSNSVSVLRNTSTAGGINAASFAPRTDFATDTQPFFVSTTDADGDGKTDILVANAGSNSLSLLRNTSTAGNITGSSFAGKVSFTTGGYPLSLAAGDLDGNATPEVVTVNPGSTSISILRIAQPQPPVITSITPASAPAGTIVTITGQNFSTASLTANTVYFGAAKALAQPLGTTGLRVTVPSGATYQPVSVLNNITGLTGYSARPFPATFTNPYGTGIPAGFYQPKVDFAAGTLPYFTALSDLDGDGRSDIVVLNAESNSLSVLRNTAPSSIINASSFASRLNFPVGTHPRSVAIGEVDGDGKPDIIVANQNDNTVSVLRNTSVAGTISFAAKVDFITGSEPFSVAINDMNGDGKPDLIVANLVGNTVSVLRNTAAPGDINPSSFAFRVDYAAGTYPRFVAVSDLNGDNRPDIAVVNERSNTVSVLQNNTAFTPGTLNGSSFGFMVSFPAGSNPDGLAAADIDGDGKTDLVALSYGSSTAGVLRNTTAAGNAIGSTSFAARVDFATGPQPFFITAADADGDSKPDLIVANSSSNNLSVLRNTATPGNINASSFASAVNFATGGYPTSVAAGDLDGDNIPELLAANAASNSVSVLKIRPPQMPPVVASFNPLTGPLGTTITISGTNFNPAPANNTVYFGAVKVPVTGGSATSLTVTAPAGATYQPLSVLNNANGLAGFSPKPFATTFTNPFGTGIPSNYYQPGINIPTNTGANSMAAGDLDGDGKVDLIVVGGGSSPYVSLYRNISTTGTLTAASFAPKVDLAGFGYSRFVTTADIDGDGKLDIVGVNFFGNSFSVFRNISTPGSLTAASFAPRVEFTTNDYPNLAIIRDNDGDGKQDIEIFYGVLPADAVSYFHNTSAPGSITPASFAGRADYIGTRPGSDIFGDVDGDGRVDRIRPPLAQSFISIERNLSSTETPVYAEPVTFPSNVSGLTLADLDGDGIPELSGVNMGNTYEVVILKVGSPQSVTTRSAYNNLASAEGVQAAKGMLLYPNPTRGEFVVQLSGLKAAAANLEIYNENGTVIEKKSLNPGATGASITLRLDLRRHPAGVYYVKVTGMDGVRVMKVTVQR